jgi:molecular chaperone GrpE (heat shock protein)
VSEPTRQLTEQIHALMRQQVDLADELAATRQEAQRQRDALLRKILEVMDGAIRAETRIADEQARAVFAAIARQTELIFVGIGMATFTFEPGVVPPLDEIEVVDTRNDPALPDMAVVRTVYAGLRDNSRIIRKAAVEINRLERGEA